MTCQSKFSKAAASAHDGGLTLSQKRRIIQGDYSGLYLSGIVLPTKLLPFQSSYPNFMLVEVDKDFGKANISENLNDNVRYEKQQILQ